MPCPCARRRAAPRPALPGLAAAPAARPPGSPRRGEGEGGGTRAPGAPQGPSLAGRLGSAPLAPRGARRAAERGAVLPRPRLASPCLAGRGLGRSDVRFPERLCPDPVASRAPAGRAARSVGSAEPGPAPAAAAPRGPRAALADRAEPRGSLAGAPGPARSRPVHHALAGLLSGVFPVRRRAAPGCAPGARRRRRRRLRVGTRLLGRGAGRGRGQGGCAPVRCGVGPRGAWGR